MIRIVMDGMCEGCVHADLELDYVQFMDGKEWGIKCIHHDACDCMETKTIHRIVNRRLGGQDGKEK